MRTYLRARRPREASEQQLTFSWWNRWREKAKIRVRFAALLINPTRELKELRQKIGNRSAPEKDERCPTRKVRERAVKIIAELCSTSTMLACVCPVAAESFQSKAATVKVGHGRSKKKPKLLSAQEKAEKPSADSIDRKLPECEEKVKLGNEEVRGTLYSRCASSRSFSPGRRRSLFRALALPICRIFTSDYTKKVPRLVFWCSTFLCSSRNLHLRSIRIAYTYSNSLIFHTLGYVFCELDF